MTPTLSPTRPPPNGVADHAQEVTALLRSAWREVLIEVAYAGVNRPECAQRAGTYPPPPDASPVLGLEVAGPVAARGIRAQDFRRWLES